MYANLDGQFLIHCDFASRDEQNLSLYENLIVTKVQNEMTTYGLNN
jgi:hypothetical protein